MSTAQQATWFVVGKVCAAFGEFSGRFHPVPLIFLLTISAFGAWLRLRQASEPLWLDELHTAWATEGQWSEVAPRAAIGNQSPLYFYATAAVLRVFGGGDFALRSLSLVAGVALPAAVWWLLGSMLDREGRGTDTRSAAVWSPLLAAWLTAVDPTNIFYSVEARPYALVQLFAVAHFGLLLRLFDRPTLALRIAWVVAAALLFYLHYTAGLVLMAEALVVAIARSRSFGGEARARYPLRMAAVDWLAVGVLLLPAVGHLLQIHARRANWTFFIERFDVSQLASAPWTIAWSGAAGYWIAALMVQRRKAFSRDNGAAAVLLGWLLVPLAVAATASATDWLRLWFPRYLLAATPAATMLAGLLPWLVGGRGGFVVAAMIAFTAAVVSLDEVDWRSAHGRPERCEDWQAAVDYLNREANDDEVLLWSGLIESDALNKATPSDAVALRAYCCYPLTARRTLHARSERLHALPLSNVGQLDDELQQALRPTANSSTCASLVIRGSSEQADRLTAELVAGLQQSEGEPRIAAQASFGRVQVVRLRIEAPSQ